MSVYGQVFGVLTYLINYLLGGSLKPNPEVCIRLLQYCSNWNNGTNPCQAKPIWDILRHLNFPLYVCLFV